MNNIKKESLKKLSGNNFIKSNIILLINNLFFVLLFLLIILSIYSLTEYTVPNTSFFSSFLAPINYVKNNNRILLSSILITLSIFSFLSFIPLKMGTYLWFSKLEKGKNISILIIFHYYTSFKKMLKAILFKLASTIKLIFSFCIFLVTTISTFIFACSKLDECQSEFQILLRLIIICSTIVILIGLTFFINTLFTQIFSNFIFVNYNEYNILTCIKSSNFLMRSNRKITLKFFKSFYYYLVANIFILPMFFTLPFFYIVFSGLTKKILYKQNQGILSIPLNEKVIDINTQLSIS